LLKAAFKAIVAFSSTAVGTFSMQVTCARFGTAWGSEKMLLRQPVFLTSATTDDFRNIVPISRVDIVSHMNDIKANNTDIKLNVLVDG
jgi:hypothetical protein